MRLTALWLAGLVCAGACRAAPPAPCQSITFEVEPFIVCTYSADNAGLKLVLSHPDGAPVGSFARLADWMDKTATPLTFAMNAGMYHEDRRPVGLYVEDGQEISPLVTRAGPGNFGLVPNGVFWFENGKAGVTETGAFANQFDGALPANATQSGPMLVIDGALHPAFNPDGTSRKRRNGVGVSADGETIYFAISDVPVNFHTFARLFRDDLGVPNALFLDGTVSKIYSADLGRSEVGLTMGPIITVVAPQPPDH